MIWKASVVNQILNFRRHVEVSASSLALAKAAAIRAFPGFNKLEWCRLVSKSPEA